MTFRAQLADGWLNVREGLGRDTENACTPTPRRRRFAVFAAVAVGGALTACGGTPSDLSVLRDDPVASLELTTAGEVGRIELDDGETLGKPSSATIQLSFEPGEGSSFDDVIAEAVQSAHAHGWDMRERGSNSYQGSKAAEQSVLRLDITLSDWSETVIVQLSLA